MIWNLIWPYFLGFALIVLKLFLKTGFHNKPSLIDYHRAFMWLPFDITFLMISVISRAAAGQAAGTPKFVFLTVTYVIIACITSGLARLCEEAIQNPAENAGKVRRYFPLNAALSTLTLTAAVWLLN